jgi:hypothetical protein
MSKQLYLEQEICEWAADRGILKKGDRTAQALKTVEEIAELISNAQKNRDIRDDIGDIYVTIAVQAKMNGTDLISCGATDIVNDEDTRQKTLVLFVCAVTDLITSILLDNLLLVQESIANIYGLLLDVCETDGLDIHECILGAYTEISGRKGKMINGVFVKESDSV